MGQETWRVLSIPFVVVGGKLDLTTGLIDAKALAANYQESGRKVRLSSAS